MDNYAELVRITARRRRDYMTVCVVIGRQCVCQPDEGVGCPEFKTESERVAHAWKVGYHLALEYAVKALIETQGLSGPLAHYNLLLHENEDYDPNFMRHPSPKP